jgi:uncharacterized protein
VIALVDTSALAKLLVTERESPALRRRLEDAGADETFVISTLAITELRRLAIRLALPPERPVPVVERFGAVGLTEPMIHLAGTFPQQHLDTLDALHLATAVVIGAASVVTYDARLADAAGQEGFRVDAPA